MTDTAIFPCPYCGHTARVYLHPEMPNRDYVSCDDTECSVCGPFADGEENAIEKWNSMPRRPNMFLIRE